MSFYLQRLTSEHEPILCYQSRQISLLSASNKLINTAIVK